MGRARRVTPVGAVVLGAVGTAARRPWLSEILRARFGPHADDPDSAERAAI